MSTTTPNILAFTTYIKYLKYYIYIYLVYSHLASRGEGLIKLNKRIRFLHYGRKELSDGIARGHCASCASVNDDYIRQSQGLDLSTTVEVTRYGL